MSWTKDDWKGLGTLLGVIIPVMWASYEKYQRSAEQEEKLEVTVQNDFLQEHLNTILDSYKRKADDDEKIKAAYISDVAFFDSLYTECRKREAGKQLGSN